jgi:hypothetical protein
MPGRLTSFEVNAKSVKDFEQSVGRIARMGVTILAKQASITTRFVATRSQLFKKRPDYFDFIVGHFAPRGKDKLH